MAHRHRTIFRTLAASAGMALRATAVNAHAADATRQTITRAGAQAPTIGDAARFDGKVRVDP